MHTSSAPATSPCHCANLRRATRAVTRFYDATLAPSGLTVTQYSLLRHLAALAPATAGALGEAMGLDRTTLVRNLRPLADRGLVVEVAGQDRRAKPLALTPAGHDALAAAAPLWRTAQAAVADHLGQPGLKQLLAGLAGLETLAP
ncbi:Transcriptional regulator, MarR family [Desulfovibrio sp. DV]|uniref:MarR family winged helix-turn-helix transcriptional regulator n=1 Tax=Desulfovibrio sp. DV TaxID=1844708 RepID=UPI00094BABE2|nr:MarR family winged helix-turn-helix transcriptional regulator [Desulfovibrio sp. DV]OLN24459.1 Transcriptional regulator, MarR family [Desulfovibrio sp. DV]